MAASAACFLPARTTTEVRDVAPFEHVAIESGVVRIRVGGQQSVSIETHRDQLEFVESLVATAPEGTSTLTIRATQALPANAPLLIDIEVPSLRGLRAAHGQVWVSGIDADMFEVSLPAPATVILSGRAETLHASIDGNGGDVIACDLFAASAQISVATAGGMMLQVSDVISGSIQGGSSIGLSGTARLDVELGERASTYRAAGCPADFTLRDNG